MTVLFVGILLLSSVPELPGADAYLAGCAAQKRSDFASAFQSFQKVDENSPLAGFARVRAAVCAVRGNLVPDAIGAFRRLAERLPEGPAKRMAQAECAAVLAQNKMYADAAALYSVVLTDRFQSPWLTALSRNAAETFISAPDYASRGYAMLAEAMRSAPLRKDKLAIAKLLVASPDPIHRMEAIDVLLDAGEYRDAYLAFVALGASFSPSSPDEKERLEYLRGRNLLVGGKPEEGRGILETLQRSAPQSPCARKGFAALARFLLGKTPPDDGLAALRELVRQYPDTVETGEVLYWYADRLQQAEDAAGAANVFLQLAEKCPSHERAPAALLAAADIFRSRGEREQARRTYVRLGERYPKSNQAPEAWFRAGMLADTAKKPKEGVHAYQMAADGPVGNFFTHRALGRLARLGHPDPRAGDVVAIGIKTTSWLREKPLPGDAKKVSELPAVLQFLAYNGLEEAEWEALHLLESAAGTDGFGEVLQSVSEAGLAATAAAVARSQKWGEGENGISVERLMVDYPRAYWPLVQQAAQETGLDPYLLLGTARQESLFQARIVSSAGATGVLQLMPKTAAWLAKVEPAISPEIVTNLDVPENSLRLGAHYLARMLERYDGNYVFALAAYNAGPGNVNKWCAARPNADMDTFIDAIPFRETRGYVRKVLGNYAAYKSLYRE